MRDAAESPARLDSVNAKLMPAKWFGSDPAVEVLGKLMGRSMHSGLRIAITGCGYWGSKHVRVLQGIDDVDEVVLVDSSETRLMNLARSYKTAPCSTALRPVLAGVDAVVVATPPSTHLTVALEAIGAGKHVLVEKPLAPTTATARRLIAAASDAGVVLMVGHTFVYNPAVRKL